MSKTVLKAFRNSYLAALLVLAQQTGFAQLKPVTGPGQKMEGFRALKALWVPFDNRNFEIAGEPDSMRIMYYQRKLWLETDTGWTTVGKDFDTTSLSNRINAKVDTARWKDSLALLPDRFINNSTTYRDGDFRINGKGAAAQLEAPWMIQGPFRHEGTFAGYVLRNTSSTHVPLFIDMSDNVNLSGEVIMDNGLSRLRLRNTSFGNYIYSYTTGAASFNQLNLAAGGVNISDRSGTVGSNDGYFGVQARGGLRMGAGGILVTGGLSNGGSPAESISPVLWARGDAGLEVQSDTTRRAHAGIAIFQTQKNDTTPVNYSSYDEAYVGFHAYNASNQIKQMGAMYMKWMDATPSTGYSVLAFHPNDESLTSLSEFSIYGVSHGAALFPRNDLTVPGNRTFMIYGKTIMDSVRLSQVRINRIGGSPSIVGASDVIIEGGGSGGDIYMNAFNAGNIYMNSAGGNVGVNTLSPASTFQVNGSVGGNIRSTSTNTTLDASDYTVIITSAISVTLPAASTATRRIYRLVNVAAGSVTISTILRDGASTTTLPNNAKYTIQSDGVSWHVITD